MNAYNKYLEMISKKSMWTESEIIYFRKAVGMAGIQDAELRANLRYEFDKRIEKDGGISIHSEHSAKGTEYLLSKSLRKNGEFRKGSKLGSREVRILKQDPVHLLVGLYQYCNAEYYFPIYRAIATDGTSFEYVGASYDQVEVVA